MMKRLFASLFAFLALTGAALAQVQGGTAVYTNWYPTGNSPSVSISSVSTAHLFPSIGPTARVCNVGAHDVYINPFGVNNSVVATTNNFWIQSGTCQNFNLKPLITQYTYFAAITSSSTTSLYIETGQGAPSTSSTGGGGGGPATHVVTDTGSVTQSSIAATNDTGVGLVPVHSSATEGSHVLCGAACNAYDLFVTVGGVPGYILVYNTTTAPPDGAVVPVFCIRASAGSTVSLSSSGEPPTKWTTGFTAVFSSTGCVTQTASATAFFSALVK